jgi:annexin A7/11
MNKFKRAALALAGCAALVALPVTPAVAAGPLLIAPFALGHVLGTIARLATLPLIAAAQMQPPEAYPQAPGNYPPQQGYYAAPQGYYPPQQGYYPAPQGYYPAPPVYYQPAPAYGYARAYGYPPAPPRYYYGPPRGDYAPYARYAGSYGPHFAYRPGGYGYRRR